jgi:hypothetical protein
VVPLGASYAPETPLRAEAGLKGHAATDERTASTFDCIVYDGAIAE